MDSVVCTDVSPGPSVRSDVVEVSGLNASPVSTSGFMSGSDGRVSSGIVGLH